MGTISVSDDRAAPMSMAATTEIKVFSCSARSKNDVNLLLQNRKPNWTILRKGGMDSASVGCKSQNMNPSEKGGARRRVNVPPAQDQTGGRSNAGASGTLAADLAFCGPHKAHQCAEPLVKHRRPYRGVPSHPILICIHVHGP